MRASAWILIALGLAIALLALGRDAIFPGASSGFGFQQAVGFLVGLAVAAVGVIAARRR